jgi:hypothetical protein
MVIGGIQNEQISRKTFYFTFGEESWTKGPALKNKRDGHSCGKIRRNKYSQEMSIIVAGGNDDGSYLSSVEILNEGSKEWEKGPELPFGIRFSQMVEAQNRGVVLIGGESLSPLVDSPDVAEDTLGGDSSSFIELNTLYKLPHAGRDAVWTKMQQKLKTGRGRHTAFLVPDNIVECSEVQKRGISGKKNNLILNMTF